MAEGITERLKDISNGIKLISDESKRAANETAQVNTKLKFDSGNVDLVSDRFKKLQTELEANNNKLTALRQAQSDLKQQVRMKKAAKSCQKLKNFPRNMLTK